MLEFEKKKKKWKVKDIAEFVENAMDSVNDFMNGKINEFHLNPVGIGICPFTKS